MAQSFFPDQFAVEFIRTSLWSKAGSRASVMVGAGFSRNAHPTSPSAREMPTWSHMAKSLCALLYADASSESYDRALREANSTSGFLRLAQEYKAAFGQSALNEQIRALVPDLEYDPSSLHRALLQLPWADVLTTNWDTLLERAALDIFDVNYDIIRTHSQISSSTRPRIVKLHGTLPAHEPFIFTEDDYRTYPRLHAPFVNLVQQTLMESVLCLIGFSGDDPNFLHWSGWVRDNLGANAPKIFLVGWLELTPSRKRMLEDRNVVPIDLAALPMASTWPLEDRHRNATEWFLQSINVREKYQQEDWPSANDEQIAFPSYLGHIARPHERLPKTEPIGPSSAGSFNTNPNEIKELISIWRWNRDMYPGWAIAPSSVRQQIWMHTFSWVHPIVRLQSAMNPYEFIKVIDELTWRLELALAPLLPELQQPIVDCLNCFNFGERVISRTVEQPDYLGKIHWPDLKITWTRVAIGVVRTARVYGNFEDAKRLLSIIETTAPEILLNEFTYEKLLILRDSADLQTLFAALPGWNISNADSIWAARKAGLLAGIGLFKEAQSIVTVELANNRKNSRRDTIDYASYSREAWLLWMEDTLNDSNRYNTRPENIDRRKFLRSIGCDILRDFNELVDRLAVELNRNTKINSGFYRNRRESITFRNGIEDEIKTALEILQFSEKTGLPRAMRSYSVLGPGLRLASSALQEKEPYLSAIANARGVDTCTDERLDFWTRNRIAALSVVNFSTLFSIILAEMEFSFSCAGDLYTERWHKQLQISLGIMARLAIRISQEQAEILLEFIFKMVVSEKCGRDVTLTTELSNLISHVFLACTRESLENRMVEIFSMPLDRDTNFPEMSELFPIRRRFDDNFQLRRDKKWELVIHNLSENLLSSDVHIFLRVHSRLRALKALNVLNGSEMSTLSNRFWNVRCKDFSIWHTARGHYPWANFLLPCTQPEQRNKLFINNHFCNDDDEKKFVQLGYVAIARQTLRSIADDFDFSEGEIARLRACVIQWCNVEFKEPKYDFAHVFSGTDSDDEIFVKGLVEIVSDLSLEREEIELVFEKIKAIYRKRPVALRLLPYIANCLLHRGRDIDAILRGIFASDDENMIRAACNVLWHWLNQINMGTLGIFPGDDIMSDVGKIIGSKRMSGLTSALELGAWVVNNGPASTRLIVLRDAEIGMTLLYDDIGYKGRLADLGVDVSSVRVAVARFALAINRYYYGAPEIFTKILETFSKDELVEVRCAALGINW